MIFHENLRGPPQKFVEKDGSKKVEFVCCRFLAFYRFFGSLVFVGSCGQKCENAFREFEGGWVKGWLLEYSVCIVHSEWV